MKREVNSIHVRGKGVHKMSKNNMKNNTQKLKNEYGNVSEEISIEGAVIDEEFYDDEELTPTVEKTEYDRKGRIANCVLLNVRSDAKADSEVLTVIKEGCEVIIKQDTNDEFCNVEIPSEHNLNGYVMKRFVKIEK